ncbi:MAG: YdcF family protein [Chlorobiaceae bacterium]|nr:YdcF family protein [Chlorobiaceae bacterium]
MKTAVKYSIIAILSLAAAAVLLFSSLGFVVSRFSRTPDKADVIVVLGGDNGLRVRKGAELYRKGYSRRLLLTGIDERFYKPGHPNWRERMSMSLGVPRKAIMIDTSSKSTWEEAVNTSETMKKKGWKSVLVVSDPPHMFRLHQTWTKAFAGSPDTFILVATEPPWWNPLLWWMNRKSFQFVISEMKKNLFYTVMYY